MLQVGDSLPAATVFLGPGRPLTLLELVEDGQFVIGRRLDGDLFEVRVSPI